LSNCKKKPVLLRAQHENRDRVWQNKADDNKQKIVANFDSSNKRKTLLYHTIF